MPYLWNNDDEQRYHASKQWLSYQKKCKVLESTAVSSEIRMYKRNTNTYRNKEIQKKNRLNFNPLRNVLCINKNKCFADIEGSTTFDTFVHHTLKHGFIPTVIPELKSITVGGAIVGGGIESSSFKYGLVHESMIECDVLLADGKIITCNKTNKYSDLFRAIPNSLGSLGYLLRIRMKIVACKKYVRLTNIPCTNHNVLADKILKLCNVGHDDSFDFIEGIAYQNGAGRILTAKMVDRGECDEIKVDKYTIFHRYINTNQRLNMLMPIKEYIWRWDSDLFWCIQYVPVLNNAFVRWYLSEHILRSDVLRYFHQLIFNRDIIVQSEEQTKKGNNMYIQDIIVPAKFVKDWLKFHFHEILYLNRTNPVQHPLWLCPTKGNQNDYTLLSINDESININFGFWSTVQWNKYDHNELSLNKFVENNFKKYKATKMIYSTVLFNKEEFYQIYNGKEYHKLKKKYDKNNKIRNLYQKCTQK